VVTSTGASLDDAATLGPDDDPDVSVPLAELVCWSAPTVGTRLASGADHCTNADVGALGAVGVELFVNVPLPPLVW
jgi:hypothetical protein